MSCERWHDAISARLDGEHPGVDDALLDAHLRRCLDCRAFVDAASALHGPVRIAEAAPMPDLSRQVRKAVAVADRASRWSLARALLAVVAIEIIAFSFPALIFGNEQDTSAHAARHLGAFTAAYGVGLLVIVVRPARARTMLPVAAVLAGALAITAVVDLAERRIPFANEVQHVPELASVVLIWLLAAPARPSAARPARPSRFALRAVDDDRKTS
jgi:predicted anti-sigma-YlaC factor YlaD